MTKLYFRYGVVSSAKTLGLLAIAHTYEAQGKKVVVMKPRLDIRFGQHSISSRAGLSRTADVLVSDDDILHIDDFINNDVILVDEVQFLSPNIIDQLREIVTTHKIPVICYGLRTNFRTELFPGSKRLLELADNIEEIKTTCSFCNKKAVFNLKCIDGIPTISGPAVELGAEELYLPTCPKHYMEKITTRNLSKN